MVDTFSRQTMENDFDSRVIENLISVGWKFSGPQISENRANGLNLKISSHVLDENFDFKQVFSKIQVFGLIPKILG